MRARGAVTALVLAVAVVVSAEASAQYEPGAVNPEQQRIVAPDSQAGERLWYGWQTLLSDFGVIGGFYLSGKYDSSTLGFMALGAYALAPPLIHFANRRPASAGLSLAMRLGLPLLVGQFASSAASCPRHESDGELHACPGIWFAIGGLLGAVTASVLDCAVLGWRPAEASMMRPRATLTPSIWVDAKGARAAVTVRF
jgi:hypothetical protein